MLCEGGFGWNASEAYTGFGPPWQTVRLVFDSFLGPAAWLRCGGPCVALAISCEGGQGGGGWLWKEGPG